MHDVMEMEGLLDYYLDYRVTSDNGVLFMQTSPTHIINTHHKFF